MVDVKISFFSILTDITEKEELVFPLEVDSSIRNLLEQLTLKFGKTFEEQIFKNSTDLSKYVLITINGKDIRALDGLNTKLNQNDEIFFVPAIAGG
ncbi:MAG: MoaD/ThiS family protein [Candidatus Lokiarchaeota archaeon]|nr:MoaD/ThiS family protein [Candidatus Lokiarchaeota archaeon]